MKAKKYSRKELNLKRDEFVDFTTNTITNVMEHKNQIFIGLIAVGVIVLVVLIGLFLTQKYSNRAQQQLAVGWSFFSKTNEQGEISRDFADVEQAARAFEQCYTKYPRSSAAPQALYYYGVAKLHLGKTDEAITAFQTFIDKYPENKINKEVYSLLANSYLNKGDYQKAAGLFQEQADRVDSPADVSLSLLKKGFCLFKLKQYEEARTLFQRVIDEFSDSPWVADAKDYILLLPEKEETLVPVENISNDLDVELSPSIHSEDDVENASDMDDDSSKPTSKPDENN